MNRNGILDKMLTLDFNISEQVKDPSIGAKVQILSLVIRNKQRAQMGQSQVLVVKHSKCIADMWEN